MNIYEVLKKDHREVKKLLKEAIKIWEEDSQEAWFIFTKVRTELTAHAKAEEETFYDPLKEKSDYEAQQDTLEGKQEHHMAALIMKEMTDIDCKDADWNAKLNVLFEMMDHHVEEEEGNIFDKARSTFSREEASQIAEAFLSKKEEYKKQVDDLLEKEAQKVHQKRSIITPDEVSK